MATIKNSSFDTNGKNNNKTNIRNGKNLTDSLLSNRKGVGTTRNGMLYSPIEDDSLESHKQTIYEAHGDLWQDAGSDAHHQYSKRTGHWYTRVWHFLQTSDAFRPGNRVREIGRAKRSKQNGPSEETVREIGQGRLALENRAGKIGNENWGRRNWAVSVVLNQIPSAKQHEIR